MRAFTRRLLRQTPRRPPFAKASSLSSFSAHRPPTQPAGRSGHNQNINSDYNSVDGVAEAQVISSTQTHARQNADFFFSSPARAHDAFADEPYSADAPLHPRPAPPSSLNVKLTKPVILDDVHDTYTLAPTEQQLSGQQLWSGTRVLRSQKHLRHATAACVVGGASAIRRIWRTYRIRPNVVYVPNTEPAVPGWCLEADLPTVIVRCSPVAVKRQLLSAEYSDGYAAEFPLPLNTVSDAASLLAQDPPAAPTEQTTTTKEEEAAASPERQQHPQPPQQLLDRPLHSPFGHHAVKAMLVLVGLRIPSNVGSLLRAAVEMGYDAAVLVNCVDATQEKVLRASDGTALSPSLRIYETDTTGQSCVSLLSRIASEHHLMPFLAVPSQEVDPAFEVAKRFHVYNSTRTGSGGQGRDAASSAAGAEAEKGKLEAPPPPQLGAMVVLGSEAQGLRDLDGTWSVPYQLVTLPLPNPMVDSYNVSVAGSVLLHLFRPAAASHFDRLVALSGEAVADLLPRSEENDAEEEEEEEEGEGAWMKGEAPENN